MPSTTRAALVTAIEKLTKAKDDVTLTRDECVAILNQLPHALVRAANGSTR